MLKQGLSSTTGILSVKKRQQLHSEVLEWILLKGVRRKVFHECGGYFLVG